MIPVLSAAVRWLPPSWVIGLSLLLLTAADSKATPQPSAAPQQPAPASTPPLSPNKPQNLHQPDPALLQQIQNEQNVETAGSVTFKEWVTRIWTGLMEKLASGLGHLPLFDKFISILPYLLVGLLLSLLGWTLYKLIQSWKSKAPPEAVISEDLQAEDGGIDPEAIDRLLAQGQTREALGKLWEYLARSLAHRGYGAFQREWTNREFVNSVAAKKPMWSQLGALRNLGRQVDRWLYGEIPVPAEEVRRIRPAAEDLLR